MTRRRWVALGSAVAVLAVGGGVAAWVVNRDEPVQGSPEGVAAAFLEAWESEAWDDLAVLVHEARPDQGERHAALVDDLEVVEIELTPGDPGGPGDDDRDGDGDDTGRATVPFHARVAISGLGEWEYDGRLPTIEADGQWWVDWSPAVVHPELKPGERLRRMRRWPERAPILDPDGEALVGPREAVIVGVEPQRIEDRAVVLAALEEHLGVDPEQVEADLDRPGVQPDWFVPVKQLRPDEFEAVRPDIYPVPGTVFQRTFDRLGPVDEFARHTLGRTGEVTAERLEELGAPYVVGDVVGLSGLELVFEERLAGRPSGEVQIVDGDHRLVKNLHEFGGVDPEPVTLTLGLDTQLAAEAALDGVEQPAAVVAVDPATGAIRAAASRPLGEFHRALAGRYPPGSTFKIVTAAAALAAGTQPDDEVECPASVSVGGRTFANAGDAAYGAIPFSEAFARSCNTVFAPLAAGLDGGVLEEAAGQFGFGAAYELPLGVAGGRFPEPGDGAEAGAAGIGQGRVQASPLHMATVAATVADGAWRPPFLLVTDAPDESDEPGEVRALDAEVVGPLRAFMRQVVTDGTGTAAAVPGATIAGKTGSAEYGEGDPPPTHAWFVGYDDRLAVAVLVEGGGAGGEVAAPLAARFFSAL